MTKEGSRTESIFNGTERDNFSILEEGEDIRIQATGLGGLLEGVSTLPAHEVQKIDEIVLNRDQKSPSVLIRFKEDR